MVMQMKDLSQPCDLSVKAKDYSLPSPGALPLSGSAAAGGLLKRKAVRDSIDDEFDEEEDVVTSSSGAIRAQPGKRSRKEGMTISYINVYIIRILYIM